MFELVCGDNSALLGEKELKQLGRFKDAIEGARGRYVVSSDVPSDVFFDFCRKLSGYEVIVTSKNKNPLVELCEELDFQGFQQDFELLGDTGFTQGIAANVNETLQRILEIVNLRESEYEEIRTAMEELQQQNQESEMRIDALEIELEAARKEISELRRLLNRGGGQCMGTVRAEIDIEVKSDPFEGICSYLQQKEKEVEVTSTPPASQDRSAEAILSSSDSMFISDSVEKAFFCLNFKNARVTPSAYSLASGNGFFNLKSWVVEVSEDAKEWLEIDRRVDNEDLHGQKKQHTFEVQSRQNGAYQYIRLTQIGPNHYQKGPSRNKLTCARFEVFGTLYV